MKRNRCLICAARCQGSTCDIHCTRARKAGISREQQIARDMNSHPWTAHDWNLRSKGYIIHHPEAEEAPAFPDVG